MPAINSVSHHFEPRFDGIDRVPAVVVIVAEPPMNKDARPNAREGEPT